MEESRNRVWARIATFYALTLIFSSFFYAATTWAPDNMVYWTGLMWSPAFAVFACPHWHARFSSPILVQ
jgi:hypothetical protein